MPILREKTAPRLLQSLSGLFLFTFAPSASALPKLTRAPSEETQTNLPCAICIFARSVRNIGGRFGLFGRYYARYSAQVILKRQRKASRIVLGSLVREPNFITQIYFIISFANAQRIGKDAKFQISKVKFSLREKTAPRLPQSPPGLSQYTPAPSATAPPK